MDTCKLKFEFYDQDTASKRLQELILYVSDKSKDDPRFGKTKLNKTILFADMLAYAYLGHPITGGPYMRLDHGPVPQQMKPVCESLRMQGHLLFETVNHYGKNQLRPIAMRKPDLREFDGEEIGVLDYVIESLNDHNATSVSLLSHDRAWRIAKDRQWIPYQAAFISDEPVTGKDREMAERLSKKHGW